MIYVVHLDSDLILNSFLLYLFTELCFITGKYFVKDTAVFLNQLIYNSLSHNLDQYANLIILINNKQCTSSAVVSNAVDLHILQYFYQGNSGFQYFYCRHCSTEHLKIQSTLIISTSVISNNHLSQGENLAPVLTWKSYTGNKILWIKGEIAHNEQFLPLISSKYFQSISNLRSQITYFICEIWLFRLFFSSVLQFWYVKNGYLEVFQRVPLTLR